MKKAQQATFDLLYQQHVSALRCQGKAENTIDAYARALRRITDFLDLCPDKSTQDHLLTYFDSLTKTHSWSTVKVDRNGLQFFYKYILKNTWKWVDIVKPPQQKILSGHPYSQRD
jgi:integrase/recombinase XerD